MSRWTTIGGAVGLGGFNLAYLGFWATQGSPLTYAYAWQISPPLAGVFNSYVCYTFNVPTFRRRSKTPPKVTIHFATQNTIATPVPPGAVSLLVARSYNPSGTFVPGGPTYSSKAVVQNVVQAEPNQMTHYSVPVTLKCDEFGPEWLAVIGVTRMGDVDTFGDNIFIWCIEFEFDCTFPRVCKRTVSIRTPTLFSAADPALTRRTELGHTVSL